MVTKINNKIITTKIMIIIIVDSEARGRLIVSSHAAGQGEIVLPHQRSAWGSEADNGHTVCSHDMDVLITPAGRAAMLPRMLPT